jgi:sulfatase maturation enzyme AslB (radical SAM superfamily)
MIKTFMKTKRFLEDFFLRHKSVHEIQTKIIPFVEKGRSFAHLVPVAGNYFRNRSLQKHESFPIRLNIEVTSICNAKCIMCPRHLMDRKMEIMPFEMYSKILREAKKLGIKELVLNGYGELFTAKVEYKKIISHALDIIPDAKIIINTNASLMNEEVSKFLIEKRVHDVHVDIDGATKETFEKIRENLKYEAVAGNVRKLIELRKASGKSRPRVRVGIIRQKENEHEIKAFYDQWIGVADYFGVDFLVSRGGSIPVYEAPVTGKPCWLLWSELNIWSDGSAVLCCDDWNAHEIMGNIKTQTISEIWTGAKFQKYRDKHLSGEAKDISLCSKCNWSRPGPEWFQNVSQK